MRRPCRALFLTVMPTPYWQDLFQAFRLDGRVHPAALYQFEAAPGTHWHIGALPTGEAVLPSRLTKFWRGRLCHHPTLRKALKNADADAMSSSSGAMRRKLAAWQCDGLSVEEHHGFCSRSDLESVVADHWQNACGRSRWHRRFATLQPLRQSVLLPSTRTENWDLQKGVSSTFLTTPTCSHFRHVVPERVSRRDAFASSSADNSFDVKESMF